MSDIVEMTGGDIEMSDKRLPKIVLSQVEDALEEREGADRRKQKKDLPANVPQDRRKGDRRARHHDK